MNPRPDMPAVAASLAQHVETLALELVGCRPSGRSRPEIRFRARGSLAVMVAGPKRGEWFDHEAGTGGDALALVAHLRGSSQRDAWEWALSWLGHDTGNPLPPPRPPPPQEERKPEAVPSATLPLAQQLWREAAPAAETLVEAYLTARGLQLPPDAPLRFHSACPRGRDGERLPAMLALMTDPATAKPCGVHRTFLAPNGRGKAPGQAKMMAGHAGIVRLVPDEEVHAGLGLAEGIETSLAVMQRLAWRPVWATTSAGGIARFSILPGIEELSIFCDRDDGGAGLTAAMACAERWADPTRRVTVIEPPLGTDFDAATEAAA